MPNIKLGIHTFVEHNERKYCVYTSVSFPNDVVVEPMRASSDFLAMKVDQPIFDEFGWHRDRLAELLDRYECLKGVSQSNAQCDG